MTAAETIRMTELTAAERGKLADTLEPGHVQLSTAGSSYLIDMDSKDAPELEAALTAFIAAAQTSRDDQAAMFSRMIAAMTPPRTAARGLSIQAQRNAEARAAFQDEFGLLSSADVANTSGARAKNTSALAGRWRRDRRIFGVPGSDGSQLYPGFQFNTSGQPRPVIARIIQALAPAMDGWSLALWFVAANGWLGNERPADYLDDDQVIIAAQQLAAEIQ
ncbi:MAG: hypothetical protein ACR2P2_00245 [Nakamurella sp.]